MAGLVRLLRRPAMLAIGFALAVLPASQAGAGGNASSDPMVEAARAIHERVFTLDSHVDIPFVFGTEPADPGVAGSWQVDLPKMAAGGLDGAFFVVFVSQRERTIEGYGRATTDALVKFEALLDLAQHQHAAVRRQPAAVEPDAQFLVLDG